MKIPYGVSSFEDIRNEGFFYVDKTPFLPVLESAESGYRHLLFVRPRRMGKSQSGRRPPPWPRHVLHLFRLEPFAILRAPTERSSSSHDRTQTLPLSKMSLTSIRTPLLSRETHRLTWARRRQLSCFGRHTAYRYQSLHPRSQDQPGERPHPDPA